MTASSSKLSFRSTSFPQVAQPVALLSLLATSVSMALCLWLAVSEKSSLLASNVAPEETRQILLYVPLGTELVSAVAAVFFIVLRGERSLSFLRRWTRLLAPLWLLWLVPVLADYPTFKPRPLDFLLLLAGFGLALERTLRWSAEEIPPQALERLRAWFDRLDGRKAKQVMLALIVLGSLCYAWYFSVKTIEEHHRLTTGTLDLGISDNLMANMLAGKFFRVPALLPDGSSMLRGHALFGAFLYLPFYALSPSSEAMLVIQATLLGFAAVPLYLFAATQIRRGYACVIAFCYLLSPIVHGPNFYDFHFLTTAPIFHFFLYWGLAKRSYPIVGLAWLALVLLREDLSMTLIPLGCVLAFSGVRVRSGLLIACASTVVFIVVKFVIMPAAGTWFFSDHYAGLYIPGQRSYGSAVITILTNPALLFRSLFTLPKLVFALHVFAPLLFLTFRNPWLFIATLGAFPSTLMVTNGPYVTDIGFQYVTHWTPYVFGGAVVAMRLMDRTKEGASRKFAAVSALTCGVLLHSWVFGAVLQTHSFSAASKPIPLKMTDEEKADYEALSRLRAMIPDEAVVAASPQMYPHISNRVNAYDLENAHGNATFLLLSPRSAKKASRTLQVLLGEAHYGLLAKQGTIYLFKRDHHSPETRKAWRELGFARLPRPPHPSQPSTGPTAPR